MRRLVSSKPAFVSSPRTFALPSALSPLKSVPTPHVNVTDPSSKPTPTPENRALNRSSRAVINSRSARGQKSFPAIVRGCQFFKAGVGSDVGVGKKLPHDFVAIVGFRRRRSRQTPNRRGPPRALARRRGTGRLARSFAPGCSFDGLSHSGNLGTGRRWAARQYASPVQPHGRARYSCPHNIAGRVWIRNCYLNVAVDDEKNVCHLFRFE